MRAIRVEEALGKRLSHDYTCIDLGFKGAIKRRGEILTERDVEVLKRCGHYYVYVDEGEVNTNVVHEEEAVAFIAGLVAGENVVVKPVEEGKAVLHSSVNGLLLVNPEGLKEVNSTGVFIVVVRKHGNYVKVGGLVGVVDMVPLTVDKTYLLDLEKRVKEHLPLVSVKKSRRPRLALLVTGTEIVEGLRKDLAAPIVAKKFTEYDCELGGVDYARDNLIEIARKIERLLEEYDGVVVTGGMSVDPSDYTPKAIELVADSVIAYGIPIKPTTMSMVAYKGEKPIIGVSSGIIHYPEENVLDVVLPWVSTGVRIPRDYLISLGNGGLMKSFLEKHGH